MNDKPWPTPEDVARSGWAQRLGSRPLAKVMEALAACEDEALERACGVICSMCWGGHEVIAKRFGTNWMHEYEGIAHNCNASAIRDLAAKRRATR